MREMQIMHPTIYIVRKRLKFSARAYKHPQDKTERLVDCLEVESQTGRRDRQWRPAESGASPVYDDTAVYSHQNTYRKWSFLSIRRYDGMLTLGYYHRDASHQLLTAKSSCVS